MKDPISWKNDLCLCIQLNMNKSPFFFFAQMITNQIIHIIKCIELKKIMKFGWGRTSFNLKKIQILLESNLGYFLKFKICEVLVAMMEVHFFFWCDVFLVIGMFYLIFLWGCFICDSFFLFYVIWIWIFFDFFMLYLIFNSGETRSHRGIWRDVSSIRLLPQQQQQAQTNYNLSIK